MYSLVNGNPIFYIGKINGVGYTNDEEKAELLERFKDEKITDEKIEVDKELKEKAIALGELQLTYSKSEFDKYLKGEKYIPELEILKLEEENKELKKELEDLKSVNKVNMLALIEVNSRLNNIQGVD